MLQTINYLFHMRESLKQGCGTHWHTPLAAVVCCSWGLVALWLQKDDILMSADKHCVLTLENLMHVLPVEVLLAAPLSANADAWLWAHKAAKTSISMEIQIIIFCYHQRWIFTQPEQLSSKCLELMTCLHLDDNLLTFFDKEFEKQSCYNFPSSSFVS